MDKIKFYREKFRDFANKNNINITQEILEIFKNDDLELIYNEFKKFSNNSLNDYLELICEDLIINGISKIERSGMKLGLHRMEEILKLFGNPEKKLRVIHIAGTNGKGSVSSYLRTVLSQKYKVGMYSSPGMISFNDRIRINDDFITYQEMYGLYKNVWDKWLENNPNSNDNLSFFEILTVVSLIYFEKNNVDFVIMEVGLGGRYDGTNIFAKKELSIITKIGLDHTDILGDTLEKIAYEKAGIIQQDDEVICYPDKQEVLDVISNVAKEKNANMTILNSNDIKDYNLFAKYSVFSYKDYSNLKIKMLGEHQIYNACLSLLVIENMQKRNIINLTDDQIRKGIENTVWAGRLEWLTDNILIDGAHNIDGVTSLINYLEKQKYKKLKILLGILTDKDYKEMITILENLDANFYLTKVPIEIKKSSTEDLKNSFVKKVEVIDDYKEAVTTILKDLKQDETLLITGSLYLISAVRKFILEN